MSNKYNKIEMLVDRIMDLETDILDKKLSNNEVTEEQYEDALMDLEYWAESTLNEYCKD